MLDFSTGGLPLMSSYDYLQQFDGGNRQTKFIADCNIYVPTGVEDEDDTVYHRNYVLWADNEDSVLDMARYKAEEEFGLISDIDITVNCYE